MKYLTEIVFAAVVCGILALIAPGGKSGLGKYVKYTASLAFLCIIISPIIGESNLMADIFDDISSVGEGLEEKTEDHTEYYGNLEIVSSEICKAASDVASEYFGVDVDDFYIKLIIDKKDPNEYTIREVTVYPSGEAGKIDSATLKEYFEEIFDSPVEVVKNGE